MNKKNRLILGVAIIAILLGYLLLTSGTANQFEVSTALAEKDSLADRVIVVNGSLVKGTEKWDPLTRTLAFKMTDGKGTMDVIYVGDKPDIPVEAVEIQVIVTGQFEGNVFSAFRMLTKCPSKYEGQTSAVSGSTPGK